jgi:hypothetical protein
VPEGHELIGRELQLLGDAARLADLAADLDAVVAEEGVTAWGVGKQRVAHPCLVEARLTRVALNNLLGKIGLDAPDENTASARGRRAARARWDR